MAVQMTRAEYEKMYGVKPVFSSTSTIDAIQPLPIRMTQAEYDAMYRPTTPDRKGVIKDIPSDIVETAKGFMSSAKKGADNFTRALTQPDLTVPQRAAGAILAAPSAVVNMAGEAILGAGKLFTSDEFEKAVAQKVGETGKAAMDTKVGKGLTDFYNELSDEDKYTLTNIIAPAANVMTAVPITKGAGAVADKTSDAIIAARNAVDPVYKKLNPTALEKVVNEIAKVEEKYAPIRKANTYAKDVDASRARIAASNVLENAVDENGLLQTTDAIKAYKAMTIDGTDNVIRTNLINEGKTVNLAELTKTLKTEIYASGLEGSDLIAALRKIDSEVEGLAQRADNIGELSLAKLQDAKISHYNNINFNTPPEVKTYRKAVARAYKETIEKKSEVKVNVDGKDFDIKGINARLAEYLGDIERLERLNGRKVEGGRLGKYTASLAGTGIGMAAGSVGGGLGAAVGGIIGGEAAQLLKGGAMSRTFKKGVKGGLPEDQVLKKAAELAKAGKKVDLKTPSKKVGAPKSVPKTKEITRTEGLIAKNVEAQKKAIKAGDFTLVATLKEVYETLVAKLKELIKEVVEAQKNPQTGQKGSVDFFAPLPKKVSKIVADMTEEDAAILRKLVGNKLDTTPLQTERTLKAMGIEKLSYGEQKELAAKILQGYDERWGGVDEVGVATTRPGALDIKKPNSSLLEEARKYKSRGVIGRAIDRYNKMTPREKKAGFINFGTDIKRELPEVEVFFDAVKNTPGAELTDDGLKIKALRSQTPEQSGGTAIRTGVFYLPDEKAAAGKLYKGGNGYGGSERMTGDILVQRPLFVKGATGGKAPEAAYDLIEGKGAYAKMRQDVLDSVTGWGKTRYDIEEGLYRLSEKYDMDESVFYDIIEFSKGGNTLPYAVQEHIVANSVRNAGYDSVLGYSKKRDGTHFLSELFDLRESTFPTGSNQAGDLRPEFNQK